MENYNERKAFINRTPVDMTPGHNFVAYETTESYALLDYLTHVEFKIFNHLVAQNPNTINGKQNPKGPSAPYKLLPSALHQVYPKTSAQSFKIGIAGLIEKGILKPTKIPDVYTFDNRPLQFRAKTPSEADEIYNMTAEEAFAQYHSQSIAQEALRLQSNEIPKSIPNI